MQKMTAPYITPEVEAIDVETSLLPNQENKTLTKDNSTNGRSDTIDQRRTSTRKRVAKKIFGEFISPQQNKRGRLSTTTLHSQDLINESGGKPKEVSPTSDGNVVCDANALGNEFDNLPLSKWVEGIRNPSAEPTPVNTVEQPLENQEKGQRDNAVIEENSEKHKGAEVSQNLPFAKNSHFWKILEEMEAFKKIPQNPHFQPLQQIKEPLREGKAIGYMVNFANVLGMINKLKFCDPKSMADDFLGALAVLETHGFNVRLLKDRVAELVEAQRKEVNLVADVKELNSRIQERSQEKGKIEEEVDGVKEEIRKLEEKLSVSVWAKKNVEDEILALRERLNETEESIQNVRCKFEGGSSVFLCG